MSKLSFEYDETGKSIISAFAYNTGHLIEELIKNETNSLKERNQLYEAKILGFYNELQEPTKSKYAEYFGITDIKEGNI